MKQYELQEIKPGQYKAQTYVPPAQQQAPVYDPDRPRTSSFAVQFQGLKQRMNNNVQA